MSASRGDEVAGEASQWDGDDDRTQRCKKAKRMKRTLEQTHRKHKQKHFGAPPKNKSEHRGRATPYTCKKSVRIESASLLGPPPLRVVAHAIGDALMSVRVVVPGVVLVAAVRGDPGTDGAEPEAELGAGWYAGEGAYAASKDMPRPSARGSETSAEDMLVT